MGPNKIFLFVCVALATLPFAPAQLIGAGNREPRSAAPSARPAPDPVEDAPFEGALNVQYEGATHYHGEVDRGAYSKLSPWPVAGRYLYSGCYDPAPFAERPEDSQCFMTVDLRDPANPVRLATVYTFDPAASPRPPLSHPAWKDPKLALLPVKVPCDTFKDPAVLAETKAPSCWDPGWNTHTHYVSLGPNNVLAVNQELSRTGTYTQASYHGVKFYDVSDPAHPALLSYWEAPVTDPINGRYVDSLGAHHFNWSGQYLFLGTDYKGFVGKILVILNVADPRHPKETTHWWIPGQRIDEYPTADWVQAFLFTFPVEEVPFTGGKVRKEVGMHYVTVYGNVAYLSYLQAGLVILDVSDKSKLKFLSRLDYLVPGFKDPTMPEAMKKFDLNTTAYGNSHSAKLVPGTNILWMTDEYFMCPFGHLRMVDVSDPAHPAIISHFLYPENTACDARSPMQTAYPKRFPQTQMAPSTHLGNTCGDKLLFLAWYGMGLRVIDISDPRHLKEVGYYSYLDDPKNPEYQGSDTYDVVFGPDNLLYVSDAMSGLRVLRYTGPGMELRCDAH
jgi:hypothetical protein